MLPVILAYATLYIVWGSTYFAIKEAVHTLHPALLIASTPLNVALFNRFLLRIPVSGAGLIGIMVGLGGVSLILFDGQSLASSLNMHTWVILAAVASWSLGTSLGRSMPAYPEVLILSGLQSLLGGLLFPISAKRLGFGLQSTRPPIIPFSRSMRFSG